MGTRTSTDVDAWLASDVGEVAGVTSRLAGALRGLGLRTVRDLLEHYPHPDRYRDVGAVADPREVELGTPVTVVGTVRSWNVVRPRKRKLTIAKADLVDDHGARVEVPFFNQQWRPGKHPPGSRVAVSGTLEAFRGTLQLKNPQVLGLDVDEQAPTAERLQPTYPATERVPSHVIAKAVRSALEELPTLGDPLPEHLRSRHGLAELDTAVRHVHRPPSTRAARGARARLVYDELLCLQLGLQQRRHRLEVEVAGIPQPPSEDGLAARLLVHVPFSLTGDQERALRELASDLGTGKPMHRLLQGDVGSGKTLVAAWAMLTALDHGRQAVLMVPTEVLAEQHYQTFVELLEPLGVNLLDGPKVAMLTGSLPAGRRRGLLAQLAVGDVDLLIGTHALLEEAVSFHDLGVVVIDEQHRFGVEHRTRLKAKRRDGRGPDVLVMTATPIPRSLALTLYGDLDVTTLAELPPGRQPIRTEVIPHGSPRREKLYAFIRERVAAGERAYVVCPLVEPSEALDDVASATITYQHLATGPFADVDVGLVHGQMASTEKEAVMEAFRDGRVQVLVSTTVIEVGVDVPEASVMVVEDADRFGISQLHQLRGRVGRGAAQSYCVLFCRRDGENVRLDALAATTDGFALAERDLELRGEGSLFDTRQSGLPDLQIARLVHDQEWLAKTRDDARELVGADPALTGHPGLAAEVRRRYGDERLEALETG